MFVSTKGRYALRVMVELAQHQGDGYVPLNVIAERQDISEKYLESILKVLVQDKRLTGLRGRGGGYRLKMCIRDSSKGGSVITFINKAERLCSCIFCQPHICPHFSPHLVIL